MHKTVGSLIMSKAGLSFHCLCRLITNRTVIYRQEARQADKNVILTAVFTKCWTKPRSKVGLLNQDGLFTLNCRHHLKLSQSRSKSRWGPGQRAHKCSSVRAPSTQSNAAAAMEIYLDLLSPPCRAVYLFAKVLGIPFEFKSVELTAGQQYSEDFEKVSIVRKVPVLKDGSFILTESTAILKYLVQRCPAVEDHWFPADPQQQARVNEYLSWQHLNLRAHCSKIFLLKALFPFAMGSEAPKEKTDVALEDVNQSLDLLEQKFLQKKLFIVSNKISLADLAAVVEVMQPLGVGVNVLEGRPNLLAWRDRVKKELGEKLFDQAHQNVMDAAGLQHKMQNSSELEKLKSKFQKLFR